ncbi:hypothetical protein UPYG_G00298540 [Umbra pygmaea]|uniref:RNA polymerase II subunit B1 CTD phosphatase RPAP2 homolog n=1 Tax=Umbra pygmaea TaxID=75934 RepID=A0ABD0W629_UMBPY
METRNRAARSSRPGKMDGSVKGQIAAADAGRREIIRETLMERMELEKRAVQVVERLLDDSVAEDFLIDCARLITPTHYKDAVEERSIVKLCGYPICSNTLVKVPTQQFRISTKTNKVYDITERKCFCSNFCYKASKSFELQISKSPLWLRQHESPTDIRLMKKGDGGSTGEEVRLADRRLREQDVENPVPLEPVPSENPLGPRRSPTASHSDDSETEQDFVSSVVSQRQRPRVHWGNTPRPNDNKVEGRELGEGGGSGRGVTVTNQKQANSVGDVEEEETTGGSQGITTVEMSDDILRRPTSKTSQPSEQQLFLGERVSPVGQSVEEAMELLSRVTVQDGGPATARPPRPIAPCSVPDTAPTTNPPGEPALPQTTQPGLSITRVGMSRSGALGLRGLLGARESRQKPVSVQLNLLEVLRRTLTEWCTANTLKFLYGPDYISEAPVETKDEVEELDEAPVETKDEVEELDEDDLEDVTDGGGQLPGGPDGSSAPVPDYNTLRRETERLELRVKEFYHGTCVPPKKAQMQAESDSENQDRKILGLPLVDSNAPHQIRKRITVEKLTRSLRDIVGPLSLTLADLFSDLNNLVRTFRLTNTNIIHKAPEWTLMAVVLLHLLSEVSPVVRESLERPASIEYLSALTKELQLQDQDVQSLVQQLKTSGL